MKFKKILLFVILVLLSLGKVNALITNVKTECGLMDCYTILETSFAMPYVGSSFEIDLEERTVQELDVSLNLLDKYNYIKDMDIDILTMTRLNISGKIQAGSDNYWGLSIGSDDSFLNSTWWNSSYQYRRNITGSNESRVILPINGTYGTDLANATLREWIYCIPFNSTENNNTAVYYNNENDTRCATPDTEVWKVQTRPAVSETGIPLEEYLLYYPFDESISNAYGFGHLGYDAINNGASSVAGYLNGSRYFNSNDNDYMNTTWIPDFSFMNGTTTFAFWIKQNVSPTYGALTGQKVTAGTSYWYIYMPYDTEEIRFRYTDLGVTWLVNVDNNTIRDGDWHHIVIQINVNDEEMKVWVDCYNQTVDVDQANHPSPFANNNYLLIGSHNNQGSPLTTEDFNGTLDNFMIINRSLTESEIDQFCDLPTLDTEEEAPTTTSTSSSTSSTTPIPPLNVTEITRYQCSNDTSLLIKNITLWNGSQYIQGSLNATFCEYNCSRYVYRSFCNPEPFLMWIVLGVVLALALFGFRLIKNLLVGQW